jgi:hypothetical protein
MSLCHTSPRVQPISRRQWACVDSSFTFSDIAFGDDVFWKVDAHRIVLDNVTESGLYSRHLAMGADVVIRNSNLAASWTLPCTDDNVSNFRVLH